MILTNTASYSDENLTLQTMNNTRFLLFNTICFPEFNEIEGSFVKK